MANDKTLNNFYNFFPGVFIVRPGTNGCDRTFDVYCSASGKFVISFDYWDEWQHASMVAFAVAEALNQNRESRIQPRREDRETISISWNVDDVQTVRPDLGKSECEKVLYAVKAFHDMNVGVNWVVIEDMADLLFPEQA